MLLYPAGAETWLLNCLAAGWCCCCCGCCVSLMLLMLSTINFGPEIILVIIIPCNVPLSRQTVYLLSQGKHFMRFIVCNIATIGTLLLNPENLCWEGIKYYGRINTMNVRSTCPTHLWKSSSLSGGVVDRLVIETVTSLCSLKMYSWHKAAHAPPNTGPTQNTWNTTTNIY